MQAVASRLPRLILLYACALLGASSAFTPPAWGAADGPSAVVQETADAAVAVLKDKNLSIEQKRQKIEEIVYTHFDFDVLARLVLARNWKQLTPEQQTQ